MCSRHAPENGADSPHALRSFDPPPEYRSYRVYLVDELGDRWWTAVNAIGPRSARMLAVEEAVEDGRWDVIPLKVEPA